jgi:hypothetical protein
MPESSWSGLTSDWYDCQAAQLSSHCRVTPTLPGISSIRSTNCIARPSLACHPIWQWIIYRWAQHSSKIYPNSWIVKWEADDNPASSRSTTRTLRQGNDIPSGWITNVQCHEISWFIECTAARSQEEKVVSMHMDLSKSDNLREEDTGWLRPTDPLDWTTK